MAKPGAAPFTERTGHPNNSQALDASILGCWTASPFLISPLSSPLTRCAQQTSLHNLTHNHHASHNAPPPTRRRPGAKHHAISIQQCIRPDSNRSLPTLPHPARHKHATHPTRLRHLAHHSHQHLNARVRHILLPLNNYDAFQRRVRDILRAQCYYRD